MEVQEKSLKDFIHNLWVLAAPVTFQMVINSFVQLIDNVMVGSLGDAVISAVSISGTFSWLVSVASVCFTNGATILISRLWGANEKDEIKKLFSFVLMIDFFIALFFLILVSAIPTQIIKIYTDVESVIPPGVVYLSIIRYAYFLNAISLTIITLLRSVRSVNLSFYISLTSCLLNVFFNWIFILGNLGFEPMGVKGAAIATLLSRIIELLVCIIYMFVFEKNIKYRPSDFNVHVSKETLRTLFNITIPLLATEILANLLSTCQAIITGHISEYYISANSIVHSAWETQQTIAFGLASATNVMIGNYIGEKRLDKVYEYKKYFIATAILLGLFISISLHFVMPILLNFYDVAPETKVLAKQLSYSASLIVFFSTFSVIIADGVLKSGGNTKALLKIDLLVNWLFAIPAGALAAFIFHVPAFFLYIILRSGNFFKVAWSLRKLKYNDWII